MPRNKHCTVTVLVGGVPLPEYTLNGQTYVECILNAPESYKQTQAEYIGGELEKQEWPVTPYRIEIESLCQSTKYFRVLVDGVKVKAVALARNESKVIKGFRDGPTIKEFLFSMPRFAKDMNDRIRSDRENKIGLIEVECWDAECKNSQWQVREKQLSFVQANKKDTSNVTHGEYTMTTSKVGRPIAHRSVLRRVDSWKRIRLKSSITLDYRMGHTLQELGITLLPLPAKSIVSQSSQDPGVKLEVKAESGNPNDPIEIGDDGSQDAVVASGSGTKRKRAVIDLTEDSDSEKNASGGDSVESEESEPRKRRHNKLSRRKRVRESSEEQEKEVEKAKPEEELREADVEISETPTGALGLSAKQGQGTDENTEISEARNMENMRPRNLVNIIREMAIQSEEASSPPVNLVDDDMCLVEDTQLSDTVGSRKSDSHARDDVIIQSSCEPSQIENSTLRAEETVVAATTVIPETNPDATADSGVGSFSTPE